MTSESSNGSCSRFAVAVLAFQFTRIPVDPPAAPRENEDNERVLPNGRVVPGVDGMFKVFRSSGLKKVEFFSVLSVKDRQVRKGYVHSRAITKFPA